MKIISSIWMPAWACVSNIPVIRDFSEKIKFMPDDVSDALTIVINYFGKDEFQERFAENDFQQEENFQKEMRNDWLPDTEEEPEYQEALCIYYDL